MDGEKVYKYLNLKKYTMFNLHTFGLSCTYVYVCVHTLARMHNLTVSDDQ